jgi:hypothetical protein
MTKPKNAIPAPENVFQFKVTLNWVKPAVWRRIQVPESYTFWDLHCAIQGAMGWWNCHLHAFSLSPKGSKNAQMTRIQVPNPELDFVGDLDESKEPLARWFPERVKQCLYTYDFGDTWDHTVLLEKILPAEKGVSYSRCLAGKNACPPEDCGGPGGYGDLRAVINRPSDPRGKELRKWLCLERGEKYDPTAFDARDVEFNDPKRLLKEYLQDQEM